MVPPMTQSVSITAGERLELHAMPQSLTSQPIPVILTSQLPPGGYLEVRYQSERDKVRGRIDARFDRTDEQLDDLKTAKYYIVGGGIALAILICAWWTPILIIVTRQSR